MSQYDIDLSAFWSVRMFVQVLPLGLFPTGKQTPQIYSGVLCTVVPLRPSGGGRREGSTLFCSILQDLATACDHDIRIGFKPICPVQSKLSHRKRPTDIGASLA